MAMEMQILLYVRKGGVEGETDYLMFLPNAYIHIKVQGYWMLQGKMGNSAKTVDEF